MANLSRRFTFLLAILILTFPQTACSRRPPTERVYDGNAPFLRSQKDLTPLKLNQGEKLRVVATTNIVTDVLIEVGGDLVEVETLIPYGADTHAYEPVPRDILTLEEAHVVVLSGLGLEESLHGVFQQVGTKVAIVSLSEGISPLLMEEATLDLPIEDSSPRNEEENLVPGMDPHVWLNPMNVVTWTQNTVEVLGALDPDNSDDYIRNARAYEATLLALDEWIVEQILRIPLDQRFLVTDHLALNYFSQRYGFFMVGAVTPAYSTAAQPSAKEVADLAEEIKRRNINAIFVGINENPLLAEQLGEDIGAKVIRLYLGSLSDPSGPAPSYLKLMEYNVLAIVETLS